MALVTTDTSSPQATPSPADRTGTGLTARPLADACIACSPPKIPPARIRTAARGTLAADAITRCAGESMATVESDRRAPGDAASAAAGSPVRPHPHAHLRPRSTRRPPPPRIGERQHPSRAGRSPRIPAGRLPRMRRPPAMAGIQRLHGRAVSPGAARDRLVLAAPSGRPRPSATAGRGGVRLLAWAACGGTAAHTPCPTVGVSDVRRPGGPPAAARNTSRQADRWKAYP